MAIFIPVYRKRSSSKRHVMFPYTTPFHVAIVMCASCALGTARRLAAYFWCYRSTDARKDDRLT